jgi:predicted HTH transcriptional regulator
LQERSIRSRQAPRFEDVKWVLLGMKCAIKAKDGDVVPTNAGIVFFGRDPQMHVMQSEVVCVLFRETVARVLA